MPNYFHADNVAPSLVRSMVAVNKKPKQFFEDMTCEGSYKDCTILLSLLMLFPALEQLYFFDDFKILLYLIPGIIAGGIFIAWLWAEYVHRALRVFHNIHVDKVGVFRVVAYANSLNVLHLTVYLSPVVLVWQTYLMYRGFVSHLGINAEVAGWLVAIPFIFITFSGLGIVMFMGVTGIIHFD